MNSSVDQLPIPISRSEVMLHTFHLCGIARRADGFHVARRMAFSAMDRSEGNGDDRRL